MSRDTAVSNVLTDRRRSKLTVAEITLRETLAMTQPFMEFLHSADANTIPEEMLGLGRKWLLDLLGVAAGATDTRMSRIMRDHVSRKTDSSIQTKI